MSWFCVVVHFVSWFILCRGSEISVGTYSRPGVSHGGREAGLAGVYASALDACLASPGPLYLDRLRIPDTCHRVICPPTLNRPFRKLILAGNF